MADQIRVRFAPSPTGYLHVGGARTALFNWLFARKMGGKFLLRIEDTDRERSSPEHTQVILDGMAWLGLDHDEDIVFQGAGLERHQAIADQLIESGHAYLDDGATRFRIPDESISWDDAVLGNVTFDGAGIDDLVILRSDRTPTYNFSVVCDDIEMKLTHVLRGNDHTSNTPKQIAIYNALGATIPTFGHVPMIHGIDGKKMSKRHGATAVGDYRNEGILPAAMRNFLSLLGWGTGDDRELFFKAEELIEAFSIKGIQKKAAVFDPAKLEWMNGQYISHMKPEDLYPLVSQGLSAEGLTPEAKGKERLMSAISAVAERARSVHVIPERVALRLNPQTISLDEKATGFRNKNVEAFNQGLSLSLECLDETDEPWTPDVIGDQLKAAALTAELGVGKLMQPIRIALTGMTVSESVTDLLPLIGKEESLKRLREALNWD